MPGTSKVSVLLSLILGLLLGAVLLVFGAYFSGFLNWENNPTKQTLSETQGTDWLQNYRCAKGETKQIIIRGVEDNYSPDGEELVPKSEHVRLIGERGKNDQAYRHYDDPEQDKFLYESFQISSRLVHGIYVVRLRELARIKSDTLTMGNIQANSNRTDIVYAPVSKIADSDYWEGKNDVYKASLNNLKFRFPSNPETARSLRDYIKNSETPFKQFFVNIADDTQVDFMGFALCLGPKDKLGMVYSLRDWNYYGETENYNANIIPKDNVTLAPAIVNSMACHIYTGCYSCEKSLPLACFNYQNLPIPDYASDFSYIWSAGEIRLTEAVRGNQFKTADDVHAICRRYFGDEWRALSTHEGAATGQILAKQSEELSSTPFWIDVKGGEHGNCWAQRPEPSHE